MTTQSQPSGAARPAPTKPVPRPENPEVTKPFWEAAKLGRLVMQRCSLCGNWVFYPRELCPECFLPNLAWAQVSGRGRVYAFTVVHQAAPAFQSDTPYVLAVIQLDEGIRMLSNVVGCDPQDVRVDMMVEAVFESINPDWTLVKFQPAGLAPGSG